MRDEYRKIATKYAYKDEQRARRLREQGKDLEATMVLFYSIMGQGLMAYAYSEAAKQSKGDGSVEK